MVSRRYVESVSNVEASDRPLNALTGPSVPASRHGCEPPLTGQPDTVRRGGCMGPVSVHRDRIEYMGQDRAIKDKTELFRLGSGGL